MSHSLTARIRDKDGNSATVKFVCRSGAVYATTENFVAGGVEDAPMLVTRYSIFLHKPTYYIIGLRKGFHLGFMRSDARVKMRIFRKLIQQQFDNAHFRRRLFALLHEANFHEAEEHVHRLETDLQEARKRRGALLRDLEAARKKKVDPVQFKLPVIP